MENKMENKTKVMAPCISYGFLHEYKGDGKKLYPTDRPDIALEIVRNEAGNANVWIHARLYQRKLLRVTQGFSKEFTDSEILKHPYVTEALIKCYGPAVCPCCGR